jgi:L,D-transpeptidase ErfK/SrfK
MPYWDVPGSIREELERQGRPAPTRVPPGPDNPLGTHWIGLTLPGIGVHGTTQPDSVYRAVSHGCIRLRPEQIAVLFTQVRVGARGAIVYEPVLLARTPDGVFLEANPDIYRFEREDPALAVRALAGAGGLTAEIDWRLVMEVLAARDGIARRVGGRDVQ